MTLSSCPYNAFEVMPRRRKVNSDEEETFGRRLASLRREAGYSQRELAAEIGISPRMMAYYEAQTERPPAHLLSDIADALAVTVDQLLGRKPVTRRKAPKNERLMRQLRKVEQLPPRARQAVIEHIEALAEKYANG